MESLDVSDFGIACNQLHDKLFDQIMGQTVTDSVNIEKLATKMKLNFKQSSLKSDQLGARLKQDGNKFYKSNQLDQAILCYSRGIRMSKVIQSYLSNYFIRRIKFSIAFFIQHFFRTKHYVVSSTQTDQFVSMQKEIFQRHLLTVILLKN